VLDTQSNPVAVEFANGTTWHTAESWDGIPMYPADPVGDATPTDGLDWFFTQVAHNNDWFFIRYNNSHSFAGDRQLMYFDTDANRSTGLPGFTGNLAVGAEFYLSGAGLNDQRGFTEWNPNGFMGFVNWVNTQDASGNWDIFVAIDRAQFIPDVSSFNFINQNHDQQGDDWYPDGANDGAGGDFFRYEIGADALPGDFNSDGVVDAADLNDPVLGWITRFGGDLDGNDFLVWQRNLGATSSTGAASAVPEPAAALLALLGVVGAAPYMRRGAAAV
jgi:hypothetical protein